mmetsp:Transcript_49973/g.128825  ORF Transcript_49973/g.128825 Transcript_49973/m.128825 type:complete len:136 (+) Transcript_49973:402-809(+)
MLTLATLTVAANLTRSVLEEAALTFKSSSPRSEEGRLRMLLGLRWLHGEAPKEEPEQTLELPEGAWRRPEAPLVRDATSTHSGIFGAIAAATLHRQAIKDMQPPFSTNSAWEPGCMHRSVQSCLHRPPPGAVLRG